MDGSTGNGVVTANGLCTGGVGVMTTVDGAVVVGGCTTGLMSGCFITTGAGGVTGLMTGGVTGLTTGGVTGVGSGWSMRATVVGTAGGGDWVPSARPMGLPRRRALFATSGVPGGGVSLLPQ